VFGAVVAIALGAVRSSADAPKPVKPIEKPDHVTPPTEAPDLDPPSGTPCVRRDFKTELVKNACAAGGQKAAKDAMKQFQTDHKIKACLACHQKLAPKYELKADGLDQFHKAGGK